MIRTISSIVQDPKTKKTLRVSLNNESGEKRHYVVLGIEPEIIDGVLYQSPEKAPCIFASKDFLEKLEAGMKVDI